MSPLFLSTWDIVMSAWKRCMTLRKRAVCTSGFSLAVFNPWINFSLFEKLKLWPSWQSCFFPSVLPDIGVEWKQILFVFFRLGWKSSHVMVQSERSGYYVFECVTIGPVAANSIDSALILELLRPITFNRLFVTVSQECMKDKAQTSAPIIVPLPISWDIPKFKVHCFFLN